MPLSSVKVTFRGLWKKQGRATSGLSSTLSDYTDTDGIVLVLPFGDLAYMFARPEHMKASSVRISGIADTASRSPDIMFDAVYFGNRRVWSRL